MKQHFASRQVLFLGMVRNVEIEHFDGLSECRCSVKPVSADGIHPIYPSFDVDLAINRFLKNGTVYAPIPVFALSFECNSFHRLSMSHRRGKRQRNHHDCC